MNNQQVETQTTAPVKQAKKSGAIWGLVFIIGGAILIAQQLGWLGPAYNWWALFILVPALASLGSALSAFQKSGKFNAAARGGLGGGIVMLTLAFMFLFGVDWGTWWPLMVLAGGVSIFLEGLGGEAPDGVGGVLNIGLWIGLSAIYLGIGFLTKNLGIYDISSVFGSYKWWAVAILIPGIGALLGGLLGAAKGGKRAGAAFGLSIFGLATLAVGVIALLGIPWEILAPTLLILTGLAVLFGIFRK